MPTWRNFSADLWPCRQTPWRDWKRSSAPPKASRPCSAAGSPTTTSARGSAAARWSCGCPATTPSCSAPTAPGEREANSLAAAAGVAPEVLAHLEDPVVLVTAFVEGPTMESPELREPGALAEVAAALRTIHGCGDDRRPLRRLPPGRGLRRGDPRARRRGPATPTSVAHAAAARIEAAPAFAGEPAVLCHDDLLPANFIATPDGIRIVDWEYAGMGNRWFDLGNFAVNNELGPAEEEAFLTAYLGAPPAPADLAALRLMRLMSDFREAMWGVVQVAISDLDFDFDGVRDQALRPPAGGDRRRPSSRPCWRTPVPRAELPDSARCVIIGGGVGGTSLAYHLAELGWDDVVLVDRNQLTSGSTFHSAGLVGQLRGSVSLTKMMMHSVDLYRRIGEESDFDPGWTECGGIRLASTEERMEELRRQAGWAKTFGLPLELISAEEAKELFPLMSTEGVLGAAWLPTDGYIDPSQLTYALADGARRGGCRIFTDTRVTGIEVKRRAGARGADRPRRHRRRGGGRRGRHVRRRDRPDGGRPRAAPADVPPVPGDPAARRGARGARRSGEADATLQPPHPARSRPARLLPRGRRRAGDGRLRAPERAGLPAARDRRLRRDPARLQRPPAGRGLGPLRGDHPQLASAASRRCRRSP